MNLDSADKFFNDVDFVSIISTIKGIYTSDGSMSTLLDFERVLDDVDLYAYRNWISGELVQGPNIGKYTVTCIFMWPYKLMPDPSAVRRLASIGCNVKIAKSQIKIPVQVTNYEDFVPGTRYPKMHEKPVWFVQIEMPKSLMNEVKEGSVDLAEQTIDLEDIDDAYEEDLDKQNTQQDADQAEPDVAAGPAAPEQPQQPM